LTQGSRHLEIGQIRCRPNDIADVDAFRRDEGLIPDQRRLRRRARLQRGARLRRRDRARWGRRVGRWFDPGGAGILAAFLRRKRTEEFGGDGVKAVSRSSALVFLRVHLRPLSVGAFFRSRISNLLNTLPARAYHIRLDRQLGRIARKN
jgi:hypothetical protein